MEEYVLIDSQRIAAEVFRKSEKGFWSLLSENYTLEGSIELASIGFTLAMRDIYDQTEELSSGYLVWSSEILVPNFEFMG